jgi:uncharacterized OB-fold protein
MPFAEDTGGGFRLVMPMKDMGIDINIRNLVRGWNAFTILRFTFVDPELGTAKPVPYAFGSVKLDGADTVLTHCIEYSDESKVRVGGRVEAIFEEKRTGGIRDIKHFRLIE